MNLAESMKHVLKSQTSAIFSSFWKDDVKLILADVKKDFGRMRKAGSEKIKQIREQTVFQTLGDVKDSALDTVTVFKVMPQRIKGGFAHFSDEFIQELERLPEQKQKALFSIKVLGALTGSTVSAFYGLRKTGGNVAVTGLRLRSAFAHYLVSEVVFKVSQVFLLRFVSEVEKVLTDENDKKNLRYFKDLLSDKKRLEEAQGNSESEIEPGDKALEIVENLRHFILTGDKRG